MLYDFLIQNKMFDKVLKVVFYFTNIVLIAIGWCIMRGYYAGFDILTVRTFVDYTSTVFIEALIVSTLIIIIFNFIWKLRKKHGSKSK